MIRSRANPLIQAYRKRKGEVPSKSRSVVIEGIRLLEEALKSGLTFEALFFTQGMEEIPRVRAALDQLRGKVRDSSPVTPEVMEALSLETTPPGLLAWAEVAEKPIQPGESPLLVLCGVRDPGNAGSLLRSAEGAGFSVWFSEGSVHPLHPKVVKASMGSLFRVPFEHGKLESLMNRLKQREVRVVGTRAHGEVLYHEWNWKISTALLLGGEVSGIPGEIEPQLDGWLTIPMKGSVESLNVAAAGAVILFEAARQMGSCQ